MDKKSITLRITTACLNLAGLDLLLLLLLDGRTLAVWLHVAVHDTRKQLWNMKLLVIAITGNC